MVSLKGGRELFPALLVSVDNKQVAKARQRERLLNANISSFDVASCLEVKHSACAVLIQPKTTFHGVI